MIHEIAHDTHLTRKVTEVLLQMEHSVYAGGTKDGGTKATDKSPTHIGSIASLTTFGWAMIDTNCTPIIPLWTKARQEDPARSLCVEARVVSKPNADLSRWPVQQTGKLWNPQTVDLERAEVVASIAVLDFSADPPPFLISKAPEGFLEPSLTSRRLAYAASDVGCVVGRRARGQGKAYFRTRHRKTDADQGKSMASDQ
ncbi:hypothetical protein V473_08850 [Sphingobium cupriresistens LL01]|uniref:Uncharacterized protein n=1 Tax=Sphingobium cupriresistens LL01 TaxID=1420583 RepID=A0A0J7Y5Z5_9SPHN|nr:hypothetical protein V473_08850 [Sphingobium cupriresistens LL01]